MADTYHYVHLKPKTRIRIKARLGIEIAKYQRASVEKLVMQVEALYVLSILKSVVFSQYTDPNLMKIINRYHIKNIPDSPAPVPYYALNSFEMN
jgi:hypothetical protein